MRLLTAACYTVKGCLHAVVLALLSSAAPDPPPSIHFTPKAWVAGCRG